MGLPSDAMFTWYGHSAWEVRTPGGKTILFDPWLANPKSPKQPADVDRCDIMLVSHGHFDHFTDALAIASRTQATWPCIHELSVWLERNYAHKDKIIGFNKGGTVEAGGVRISMVRSDHSSGDIYGSAEAPIYFGEPAGFVVELENGGRIYFAGDTDVFGDMELIRERHRPEVAMLPIGGHFTMDPAGAARAVELLGVDAVIPMHYGTFPVLAGTPDQLRAELASRSVSAEVHVVEPGGTIG